MENLQTIQDEIEAIQCTLTEHEFKITKPLSHRNYIECLMQVVPETAHPRVVLRLTLSAESYPSELPPQIKVEGYWKQKEEIIISKLTALFEPNQQVLFDWYSFMKADLFQFDGKPDERLLVVKTIGLEDELYETKMLKACLDGLDCSVCFNSISDREEMFVFKTCLHSFCKSCIRSDVSQCINAGDLQKIRCPAVGIKNQRCTTQIQEKDLVQLGVSEELIAKLTTFSIQKAIDSMDDFGWCPNEECQAPAEINKDKMLGECTQCLFKFCSSCRRKYHPFKRCETTILASNTQLAPEHIENLMNEAKSIRYLKFCSKACPQCNNPIQKSEGCNKMICARCSCKFCWRCLGVLPEKDPYSHFTLQNECWDISAAHIPDEMNRPNEEEEETKYVQEQSSKILKNCARCPQCSQLIDKGRSRLNLMKCHSCRTSFCFLCASVFQSEVQSQQHFEVSNCYFKDI